MASHDQIVERWLDVELGRTKRDNLFSRYASIIAERGTLYSYGRHFPLAVTLRDPDGYVRGFLLNGDRYSNSTSKHQAIVRRVLSGQRTVIIPFSALNSAGIDSRTVEVINQEDERWDEWDEVLDELPSGYVEDQNGIHPKDATWRTYNSLWSPEIPRRDEDGVLRVTRRRHWLGGSVIKADVRYFDLNRGHRTRSAYFLSGFDANESRPSYFFCELPKGARPTTLAEAYEALKPEVVKRAEADGREIKRQGDIFMIPMPSIDLRTAKSQGAKHHKRQPSFRERTVWNWRTREDEVVKDPIPDPESYILGTNHTASEVLHLPGGLTLVRGVLRHEPDGRRPDHARVSIGKTWHLAVKNTVPLVAKPRARRQAAA